MNENKTHDTPDDAEGHFAATFGTQPGAAASGREASFVLDTPHASDADDAEGHLSGAVRPEPMVPSVDRDLDPTHPKADDPEMF